MTDPAAPTSIRYRIIGVTMVMSFIFYLDRIAYVLAGLVVLPMDATKRLLPDDLPAPPVSPSPLDSINAIT